MLLSRLKQSIPNSQRLYTTVWKSDNLLILLGLVGLTFLGTLLCECSFSQTSVLREGVSCIFPPSEVLGLREEWVGLERREAKDSVIWNTISRPTMESRHWHFSGEHIGEGHLIHRTQKPILLGLPEGQVQGFGQ